MPTEYLNNKLFEELIDRFQKAKREKTRYEYLIGDVKATKVRKLIRKVNSDSDEQKLTTYSEKYTKISGYHSDLQKELAAAFYLLSQNAALYAKRIVADPDDAAQDGVIICFEKVDKFDSRRGKAFNYFSTIIINSFRQTHRSNKTYMELKKKFKKHLEYNMDNAIIWNRKDKLVF